MSQQYPQQPQFQPGVPFQPPKKKHTVRNVFLVIGLTFVVLVGGCTALLAAGGDGTAAKKETATGAGVSAPAAGTTTTSAPPPASSKPAAPDTTEAPEPEVVQPSMTKGQEQAVGSAESYLSFTAFSRKGLIRQLSSSAGEGFSVADATFAVDHLKVNWNEQAVKSAKKYLEMTHFSRKGLIRQLESSAGEGFTHAQAVYGVSKAGL
jgi:hypothetical protein